MNLNTFNEFRHGMYGCFGNGKDALFNLVDALSSEAGARSFPELSFSPFFERTWASLYEALEDGQIDAERLRKVFVDCAPLPQPGELVFLGVDTSNLYRPEAETAEDRTLVPIANLPEEHARRQPWMGDEPCDPLAHPSRSRHLRAGYGAGEIERTGHRGRCSPIAGSGGAVGRPWVASHHSR